MELIVHCLLSTYFPVFLKKIISFSELNLLILRQPVRGQQEHMPSKGGLPRGGVLPPWLKINQIKPWANWPNAKWNFSLQIWDHQAYFRLHGVNQCRFTYCIIFIFLFPPSLVVPPDICWFGLWVELSREWSAMSPKDYPTVHSALAKPHLDTASGFGPQCKKGINKVERVQLMAPRWLGWSNAPWGEARENGLVQPGKKKVLGRPNSRRAAFLYPYQEDGAKLLTMWHGRRMRENKHKLKQERFKLDINSKNNQAL